MKKGYGITINCLICEETIVLTEYEEMLALSGRNVTKICDKCKKAVLAVRAELEAKD